MSSQEVLRRLTIGDPALVPSFATLDLPDVLDARSVAILRLGALITDGTAEGLTRQCVSDALDAGLTSDEIVGALISLAPTIGIARVSLAARDLATALGYDVDAALERLDEPGGSKGGGS